MEKTNSVCPNCGYCPHCGRSNGQQMYPYRILPAQDPYPWVPFTPIVTIKLPTTVTTTGTAPGPIYFYEQNLNG